MPTKRKLKILKSRGEERSPLVFSTGISPFPKRGENEESQHYRDALRKKNKFIEYKKNIYIINISLRIEPYTCMHVGISHHLIDNRIIIVSLCMYPLLDNHLTIVVKSWKFCKCRHKCRELMLTRCFMNLL